MSEMSMEDEYGPKVMPPVHPGEILREEFLFPMDITTGYLAQAIGVDTPVVQNVVDGGKPVTAEIALLLSRFLGTSPDLWMGLQAQYDLDSAEERLGERLDAVVAFTRK